MLVIEGRNVEEVMFTSLIYFSNIGIRSTSRNGPVIELPTPVTSVYRNPMERVVFDPVRDCNPFLHFFESLWMLAGSNELNFVAQFARNMENFSDDGLTLNGAYGHRWRHHFGYDQLMQVIDVLKRSKDSRRAVISMWDGWSDLRNQKSKDLPCNTQVVFRVTTEDALDMTVFNRSNDAIWGAYGANAVHFSFLQELVAGALGIGIGAYRQVSNNLHVYPEIPVASKMMEQAGASAINHYDSLKTFGMFESSDRIPPVEALLQDFRNCVEDGYDAISWSPMTEFYSLVAVPLGRAWRQFSFGRSAIRRKSMDEGIDRYRMAYELCESCEAEDWRFASKEWIKRRIKTLNADL